MEFEKAETLRKKIEHLENYQERSVIVNKHHTHADIFSMKRHENGVFVNYLMVQNGTIVQTHTTQIETHLEEKDEEILSIAIAQLRDTFNSTASEIIVPFRIDYPQEGIILTVPKAGDKKKLLELSEKNVDFFLDEWKKKRMLHINGKTDEDNMKAIVQLMKDLQLSELPVHIECFDNSNFQGSFAVSAMVCFKNGVKSPKDYRHFNVKTVQGINDFATMKEVVLRRYKRLVEEGKPLPQLVIIDGGKGQLHAALESIRDLKLDGKFAVIGLAKNEEELFFPGDQESLKLPYDSESLRLIRRIRDEVHRFGISFHRLKRSKGTFTNELEKIEGIGKSTAASLLKEFRSVNKIKQLQEDELKASVGPSKARIIKNYFEKQTAGQPQDNTNGNE